LDAEQRDDGLKCIEAEKRFVLLEEELAEQSKELAELKQEQSNPVPKNIRGRKDLFDTNAIIQQYLPLRKHMLISIYP
jgi:hypothetical protein